MNSRKLVVCDADVLIHLAKLKIVPLVTQIFKILIPKPTSSTNKPHSPIIVIAQDLEGYDEVGGHLFSN